MFVRGFRFFRMEGISILKIDLMRMKSSEDHKERIEAKKGSGYSFYIYFFYVSLTVSKCCNQDIKLIYYKKYLMPFIDFVSIQM